MAAICQKNRTKCIADFNIHTRGRMIQSAKLAYLHELLQKSHEISDMASQLWSQVNAVIGRQSTTWP